MRNKQKFLLFIISLFIMISGCISEDNEKEQKPEDIFYSNDSLKLNVSSNVNTTSSIGVFNLTFILTNIGSEIISTFPLDSCWDYLVNDSNGDTIYQPSWLQGALLINNDDIININPGKSVKIVRAVHVYNWYTSNCTNYTLIGTYFSSPRNYDITIPCWEGNLASDEISIKIT